MEISVLYQIRKIESRKVSPYDPESEHYAGLAKLRAAGFPALSGSSAIQVYLAYVVGSGCRQPPIGSVECSFIHCKRSAVWIAGTHGN